MIVVTSSADAGAGTLRDAIAAATPGEEITFTVNAVNLTSGQLTISSDVRITGPGSGSLTITRTAGSFRIFFVTTGAVNPVISGLTISNGEEVNGAGIYLDQVNLTLQDVVVTGCNASGIGGGIYNDVGTMYMSDVVISDCVAGVDGGGLYHNGGTITAVNLDVIDCTATGDGGGIWHSGTFTYTGGRVSGCSAGDEGGGLYNTGFTWGITQVTIDDNSAPTNGDGVYNIFGTITFTRCTISNNVFTGIYNRLGTISFDNGTISGNGDVGVYNSLGAVLFNRSTIAGNTQYGIIQESGSGLTLQNTILAGNGIEDLTSDTADVSSTGNNIFGTTSNPVTPASGDQMGVATLDLHLGPLQDNGGPTFTMALLMNSVALDAGNPASAPTTDQRGQPRITGAQMDVGAYEAALICLTFTGTLPNWLTIEEPCFQVVPGSFRGSTKAEANAAAQAALDAFVAAALESGDLVCNS